MISLKVLGLDNVKPMNMEREITAWDGKSADDIADIFKRHHSKALFIDTLIKLIDKPASQKGATWLLKAWFDDARSINQKQASSIIDGIDRLDHWEAKLHILQCMPFLTISQQQKLPVEQFLRATLTDKNKFVRAWSYHGFYELARQHPEYQDEANTFFAMALRDEAASVKARVRNIMKKGF